MTPINNNQMSEELREIILSINVEGVELKAFGSDIDSVSMDRTIKKISTLISHERAEAVRGFVNWICNIAETQMAKPVLGVGQIKSASEEYLSNERSK